MRKRITLSFVLLLYSVFTFSQIPNGYYDNANGKTGATLKTALYNIIKDHTSVSYTPGLWDAFQTTDKKNDGTVWDMYSNCSFTFGTDQDAGSGGTAECQYYNREHSFPKSWFGGEVAPMYTDLFHLYPTDKYVNNQRGNVPFGEVYTVNWTSGNGSKLGTTINYITVFEPVDEYKGDFARTYLYMATRYENLIASWKTNTTETQQILDGNSYPAFQSWYVALLLKWNTNDPVSQKEIDRNNAVYSIQGNRNPFIDHPEYADAIWNPSSGVTELKNIPLVNIYPNPAKEEITVETTGLKAKSLIIVNVIGNIVLQLQYDGTKQPIDISKLNPGVYFVNIMGDNFKNTTRIVVY